MNTLEIVLLITGGLIFIASFFVPFGTREADKDTRKLVEGEVKNAVHREIEDIKGKIEDIVEETVTDAMEKTERSLERVSNEKIMAVNEYSDTVLEEINKNHKEVLFLYDMLNDKHKNLTSTVSKVEKAVKEVEQTAKEYLHNRQVNTEKTPTDIVNSNIKINTPDERVTDKDIPVDAINGSKQAEFILSSQQASEEKVIMNKSNPKFHSSDAPTLDISFTKDSKKNGNNNERILELHNQGKSNVSIAKELGLGVGEVKLVIDLFEGL